MVTPKTACDQEIVRYMVPRLVAFVTAGDTREQGDSEDPKGLVCYILTSFISTLFGDQIQIAMTVILPTLLAYASSNPRSYQETATRLLELVALDQKAFKSVVANLGPTQRSFMEEVLRSNAKSAVDNTTQESAAPSIALKMNFGS
jgi:hypothetical protein